MKVNAFYFLYIKGGLTMIDKKTAVQGNTDTAIFDLQLFAEENVVVESPTPVETSDTGTIGTGTQEKPSEKTTQPETTNVPKPTENQPAEPPAVTGAPEQYGDFTAPEGFTAPIDDFKAWAKEQNLTQEAAQSAVDFYVNKIAPQQLEEKEKQMETWKNESVEKYGNNGIDAANKALGRFSTPEFKEFLNQTGLGNHPEMIGLFKSINEQISESGWVEGKSPTNSKSLYPNSPEMYDK